MVDDDVVVVVVVIVVVVVVLSQGEGKERTAEGRWVGWLLVKCQLPEAMPRNPINSVEQTIPPISFTIFPQFVAVSYFFSGQMRNYIARKIAY